MSSQLQDPAKSAWFGDDNGIYYPQHQSNEVLLSAALAEVCTLSVAAATITTAAKIACATAPPVAPLQIVIPDDNQAFVQPLLSPVSPRKGRSPVPLPHRQPISLVPFSESEEFALPWQPHTIFNLQDTDDESEAADRTNLHDEAKPTSLSGEPNLFDMPAKGPGGLGLAGGAPAFLAMSMSSSSARSPSLVDSVAAPFLALGPSFAMPCAQNAEQTIARNSALVLVSLQVAALQGAEARVRQCSPQLEHNVKLLLHLWRNEHIGPILHVHHIDIDSHPDLGSGGWDQHKRLKASTSSSALSSPFHLSKRGIQVLPWAEPVDGEQVLHKTSISAFLGTNLEARLKRSNCRGILLVGLSTSNDITSTVQQARGACFDVVVAEDACADFGVPARNFKLSQGSDTQAPLPFSRMDKGWDARECHEFALAQLARGGFSGSTARVLCTEECAKDAARSVTVSSFVFLFCLPACFLRSFLASCRRQSLSDVARVLCEPASKDLVPINSCAEDIFYIHIQCLRFLMKPDERFLLCIPYTLVFEDFPQKA